MTSCPVERSSFRYLHLANLMSRFPQLPGFSATSLPSMLRSWSLATWEQTIAPIKTPNGAPQIRLLKQDPLFWFCCRPRDLFFANPQFLTPKCNKNKTPHPRVLHAGQNKGPLRREYLAQSSCRARNKGLAILTVTVSCSQMNLKRLHIVAAIEIVLQKYTTFIVAFCFAYCCCTANCPSKVKCNPSL